MKHLLKARAARPIFAAIAIAAAAATGAPASFAQGTAAKPAAKGKPDPKKAAEDQKKADEAKAAEEKAAEDQKKADEAKAAEEKAAAEPKPAVAVEPPHEQWDIKDVEEIPSKNYLFIGARYRGNIIPQFILNLFVDKGATVYSNTIGIELDKRKDGFSLIPALSFTEYGTGDILFKEKDSKELPGNYTFVNSSMKAFYATVDLLWSTKISKNLDFEYGAGFGLGIIFGGLSNNWVHRDPNGPLEGFAKCQTEGEGGPGSGCNKADHKNADTAKVGDYTEKSWFDGGSKPVLFPWISIPQVGLRLKPVKQFEARLGLGFALTGFWFGLSGNYGLEQKPKP